MRTNYLISNFDSLNLPSTPEYEVACALSELTTAKDWQPLIEQICLQQNLSLSVLERASSGENPCIALSSETGKQYFIKFIAPNWLFQYHNEKEALTLCADAALPIQTPQLVASGEINGWGYLLTEKLEGELLSSCFDTLSQAEKQSLARQLGAFCLQLHSMPMVKKSRLYTDWQEFIKAQYHNSYARRKRQGLRADYLADFIPYIAHTPYSVPESSQLHLIHSDLHSGNLLVSKKNGEVRLSGVIDFGDALICNEPVFEFTTVGLLIAKGDAAVFSEFLESYLYQIEDSEKFVNSLMSLTLLRHTGNLNYLIEHVPNVKECNNWKSAEPYLFPLKE